MSKAAAIELAGVTKRYGTTTAVDRVSLKVKAGTSSAKRTFTLKPGTRKLTFAFGAKVKSKQARVAVNLKDASGVSFTTVKKVNLPKVIKKKSKKRH